MTFMEVMWVVGGICVVACIVFEIFMQVKGEPYDDRDRGR